MSRAASSEYPIEAMLDEATGVRVDLVVEDGMGAARLAQRAGRVDRALDRWQAARRGAYVPGMAIEFDPITESPSPPSPEDVPAARAGRAGKPATTPDGRPITFEFVHQFLSNMLEGDFHAKRVLSLAGSALGAIHAASASIHAIGRALAVATRGDAKHATKQVDRLLSNAGINVWTLFSYWVRFVLADRKEALVAFDWTDFDADGHAVIAAYLITSHGRATPLVWKTVRKDTLEGHRNEYEDEVLGRLVETKPEGVKMTILADRGFGDQKLYESLEKSGLHYIIRFRECIIVSDGKETSKPAAEWVPKNGRIKSLQHAKVTADRAEVPVVVLTKAKGMKDAWCLASNRKDLSGKEIVKYYGKRFTIEETFRDKKDIHFGMGLSATHIGRCDRRDRLLFLMAIAHALMTLLGAAGEAVGLDKGLKVNTSKKRQLSLYNQGCYWYSAIPYLAPERLALLMTKFGEMVAEHQVFTKAFGIL